MEKLILVLFMLIIMGICFKLLSLYNEPNKEIILTEKQLDEIQEKVSEFEKSLIIK